MSLFEWAETGIYKAITTSPGTARWQQRVYSPIGRADDPNFGYPFVVFNSMFSRNMNSHNEGRVELWYQIGVWATDDKTAKASFWLLHDAIHEKHLDMTPLVNTWSEARDYYSDVENTRGSQYYYRGALFRLVVTNLKGV